MPLRNVTITLPEETARWVRIKAAEEDTSVSQYLGRLVDREREREESRGREREEKVERDQSYWQAYEEWKRETHPLPGFDASRRGSRAEIYDRQIMKDRKLES